MTEQRKALDSYSESEIEEAFLASFAGKAAYNYINSYSLDVDRDYDDDHGMKVIVEIGSMAGTPTKREFEDLKDMKEFELTFVTGKKAMVGLVDIIDYNAMEYHAIYAEKGISLASSPEDKASDTLQGGEALEGGETETTLAGSIE